MDVHLRDLRYFVAAAEELHFTAAAERLHVSQPALSKQVRLLERHLGAELFLRHPRSVSLTAAGAALLDHARAVLAGWDGAVGAVRRARATERRVLVVGIHTGVGRDLQRRTLAAFAQSQPEWQVSLRLCSWADPSAGLADGTSDVAYLWLPAPDQPLLVTHMLCREPRWVALPDDHRLADRAEISWPELLDEPFIALPTTAWALRDFWLAVDERPAERPAVIAAEVTNAEETFELVGAGIGIALLAAGNARIYQRPGIRTVPVPDLALSQLAIARRRDDRRPAVSDLVAAATAAAGACVDRSEAPTGAMPS